MKTYERPQVFCQEDLCEGCPADNGSFCTLTKGYTTGDKDYRPTWERNGESPDKITWINVSFFIQVCFYMIFCVFIDKNEFATGNVL